MLNKIIHIDEKIFLILNGSHSGFADTVMYWVSDKFFWIPFYCFILWLLYSEFRKKTLLIIAFIVILVAITDQTSVLFFKNNFMRLRPCFEPRLSGLVHLAADSCGGMYGFISNHAANTFAFAWFIASLLRHKWRWIPYMLFTWAVLVSYSRVYLGVHYPGDVIAGAAWGVIVAVNIEMLYRFVEKKIPLKNSGIQS